jgi:ubiquitin C
MQIFIKMMSAKTLTLEVAPTDTVASVKARIQELESIAVHSQRLIFGGRLLEDAHSLQQCNILTDGVIHLAPQSRGQSQSPPPPVAQPVSTSPFLPARGNSSPSPPPPSTPPPIQVFVKLQAGKVVPLTVQLSDTVSSVKVKVQEAEGLPCHDQRLIFGGREMDDGSTLSQYVTPFVHCLFVTSCACTTSRKKAPCTSS